MLLSEISKYIQGKLFTEDLRVKTPEVAPSFEFSGEGCSETVRSVYKALNETLPIVDHKLYEGRDISRLILAVYPEFPWHLKDKDGNKWRIGIDGTCYKCITTGEVTGQLEGTYEVIDSRRYLEGIIKMFRPKKTKRSKKALGMAYRYNKLLWVNGFPPEEFPWIEKNDVREMIELENFTLSEAKLSPFSTFEREGVTYHRDEYGWIVGPTGKRTSLELGWTWR